MPECKECRKTFKPAVGRPGVSKTLFCSRECSQAFGNRRMKRGAEIYDLFYACRFDRDEAKKHGAWNAICQLAIRWREEDAAAGRDDLACHSVAYMMEHLFSRRDLRPEKNLYIKEPAK